MTRLRPITHEAPPLEGRAIASQRWSDLTFLHWRVRIRRRRAAAARRASARTSSTAPSWVGLIPFRLDRATLFGSPPVPYLGSFVELNVRLYGVDFWGRRGVVFRSLEASRLAAVLAARAAFRLPYFWSRTRMQREGRSFGYDSQRHGGGPSSMVRVADGRADPSRDRSPTS